MLQKAARVWQEDKRLLTSEWPGCQLVSRRTGSSRVIQSQRNSLLAGGDHTRATVSWGTLMRMKSSRVRFTCLLFSVLTCKCPALLKGEFKSYTQMSEGEKDVGVLMSPTQRHKEIWGSRKEWDSVSCTKGIIAHTFFFLQGTVLYGGEGKSYRARFKSSLRFHLDTCDQSLQTGMHNKSSLTLKHRTFHQPQTKVNAFCSWCVHYVFALVVFIRSHVSTLIPVAWHFVNWFVLSQSDPTAHSISQLFPFSAGKCINQ